MLNYLRSFTVKLKEYKITMSKTNILNVGFRVYILTVLFDVSNTSYYVEVENGALFVVMEK